MFWFIHYFQFVHFFFLAYRQQHIIRCWLCLYLSSPSAVDTGEKNKRDGNENVSYFIYNTIEKDEWMLPCFLKLWYWELIEMLFSVILILWWGLIVFKGFSFILWQRKLYYVSMYLSTSWREINLLQGYPGMLDLLHAVVKIVMITAQTIFFTIITVTYRQHSTSALLSLLV